MGNPLKTRLVRIGNSQGIRIPKAMLEQAGLTGEVELEVQSDQLVIRPSRPRRHGWEARFREMAASGDDRLLDEAPPPATWDEEEWTW